MSDTIPATVELDGSPAAARDPLDDLTSLRALVEGTAASTGEHFFQCLARSMAEALGVKYAFVAEFLGNCRARTLAYWMRDAIVANVEWDLRGTPCEDVVSGDLCHHAAGVKQKFSRDTALVELGIEGYLGVPLRNPEGETLGHLAVFDDRPIPADPRRVSYFKIFAARATGELLRLGAEKRMRESEERFRDLFEEAPIAYVHEDLDSRFISANKTAIGILGLKPEEVVGTLGKSLVPDTPEAQRRVTEALQSIGRGTDTSGVVLELRRKDNGQPIWIQWWSRPDPGGHYTRTMFLDITDRVLMEQEQARLQAENLYLQEEIKSVHNFEEIVGRCEAMTRLLDSVRQVAPTDASVLICGETGTGKELIARAIHSNSRRSDKPLIKVNCAALPTGLVESELFGHERGAFSGAIARRIGRFELADGGTIFLDEIGEMPLDVQVKLLRVLQEREFERVGGSKVIRADVRVIAATNRDLARQVRDGKFREDLFYRLNVFPLELPPLRERASDIPLLAQFLIGKFSSRIGKPVDGLTPETLLRFQRYVWPGNVRELENVIERAVIIARSRMLDIDPALARTATAAADRARGELTLEELERQHIQATLEQTGWVIDGPRGAARILGLHPNTLRSRLKKLQIQRAHHEGS